MITNTTDIIHHIEKTATESAGRLKSTRHWTTEVHKYTKATHSQRCNELWEELLIPKQHPRDKVPKVIQDKKYTCKIDLEDSIIKEDDPNTITVYTDGSKNTTKNVGLGAHSEHTGITISENLPEHCTVFQAEVMAVKRAAEELNHKKIEGKTIHIRSDSTACIRALDRRTTNSLTVQNCNKELNKLGSINRVTIRWVKAHIGIPGNEAADELAKEGCKQNTQQTPAPIPDSDIRNRTRQRADKRTLERFIEKGGKYTYRTAKDRDSWDKIRKQIGKFLKMRNKFRTATQLITNIGPFNWYLNVLPICPLCNEEEETVQHLICECPAMAYKRETLLNDVKQLNVSTLLLTRMADVIKLAEHAAKMKKMIIAETQTT